ncbi:glycosyl hydrolase family 28-related protein [Pontiella agarivorans]|uniref:Glycosyl hydrolase family 28-related protein n=1 Tax=Pontiella agarivorans TaxID=3038953 RepID=A0ABU5MSF7_9BACT|nr:glycosyl hydrolase family 28-related protein [Pontiella agarivorans]MDZ8117062.1 glycosyl hydrolase family 28-related protein [Pontiella agarivorans]
MKQIIAIAVAGLMTCLPAVQAEYTETMDPNGLTMNAGSDFGLKNDGAKVDQSATLQQAIDALAEKGGGRLIVPKGTYGFKSIKLRSNIHLLIEKDTVIKPDWPEGEKIVVFSIDAERPSGRNISEKDESAYIENVSIRGLGGPFIVDYSGNERSKGEGSRAVLAKMVKNFLIENMDIQDNYTTYCGITLAPLQTDTDISKWTVSRATDGTIRNCRIFNASPGYGLTQLHGAQSVHFENLYADGGVTLRMETGAIGPNTAIYDITGKNIVSENGRCAVMMGPHSAQNGLVQIEQVKSIGSSFAVMLGSGHVKKGQLKKYPDSKPGCFAEGSYVKDIHVVFGRKAQVKGQIIMEIPQAYYPDMNLRWENKFFEAPSIGAVRDGSEGAFDVRFENITMEGFRYNADKPILTKDDARPGSPWPELDKWKKKYGHASN